MACKFHAAMSQPFSPFRRTTAFFMLAGALLLCSIPTAVRAEKADRFKKMEVESDQPGKVDLQNQIVVFNGNVVVTKGTMVIRANRIEVRESAEGYQYATAIGATSQLASFRQKREGVTEFIEGQAERLEYDTKSDTVRFIGKASMRRLVGTTVADEATGALITYDNAAEVFTVAGGASAATPANPTGRIKVTISPRDGTPAAAEAASAAQGGKR
jgi:lipopolysaccharide export system protein LptA